MPPGQDRASDRVTGADSNGRAGGSRGISRPSSRPPARRRATCRAHERGPCCLHVWLRRERGGPTRPPGRSRGPRVRAEGKVEADGDPAPGSSRRGAVGARVNPPTRCRSPRPTPDCPRGLARPACARAAAPVARFGAGEPGHRMRSSTGPALLKRIRRLPPPASIVSYSNQPVPKSGESLRNIASSNVPAPFASARASNH